MTHKHACALSILVALMTGVPMLAAGAGASAVVAKADLKWKDLGNGIAAAQVSGNMDKGASRFYLKYPVGLAWIFHLPP